MDYIIIIIIIFWANLYNLSLSSYLLNTSSALISLLITSQLVTIQMNNDTNFRRRKHKRKSKSLLSWFWPLVVRWGFKEVKNKGSPETLLGFIYLFFLFFIFWESRQRGFIINWENNQEHNVKYLVGYLPSKLIKEKKNEFSVLRHERHCCSTS